MILTPFELQAFLAVCKQELEAINHVNCFIDDSQMVKGLDEVNEDDDLLLFGILPDYGGDSSVPDSLMMDNGLDFLILKKLEYRNLTHQEFVDVMQETLLAAREFVAFVHKRKNEACDQFHYLKEGSEQITPVWAKAGCNGYMVSFNLRTSL